MKTTKTVTTCDRCKKKATALGTNLPPEWEALAISRIHHISNQIPFMELHFCVECVDGMQAVNPHSSLAAIIKVAFTDALVNLL